MECREHGVVAAHMWRRAHPWVRPAGGVVGDPDLEERGVVDAGRVAQPRGRSSPGSGPMWRRWLTPSTGWPGFRAQRLGPAYGHRPARTAMAAACLIRFSSVSAQSLVCIPIEYSPASPSMNMYPMVTCDLVSVDSRQPTACGAGAMKSNRRSVITSKLLTTPPCVAAALDTVSTVSPAAVHTSPGRPAVIAGSTTYRDCDGRAIRQTHHCRIG